MSTAIITVDAGAWAAAGAEIRRVLPTARRLYAMPAFLVRPIVANVADAESVPGVVGVHELADDVAGLIVGIDYVMTGISGRVPGWGTGGVALGDPYPFEPGTYVGVTAPSALCVAVNLSLTPPDDDVAPTLATDPVNAATRALSAHAVPIVAAGNNHRPGAEFETVSPWAEPDWVLAVGATTDRAGTTEWERSARGTVTSRHVGPDLLTWGQDGVDPSGFGTSFAAARASTMVAVAAAYLATVGAHLDRLAGRPFGVPLIGVAVIDRGFARSELVRPRRNTPALPVFATTPDAFHDLDEPSRRALRHLLDTGNMAHGARRLVEQAAAETSLASAASAPSLSDERFGDWLAGLSGTALLSALRSERTTDGGGPLFDRADIGRLWAATTDAMPLWQWNITTYRPSGRRTES